ncbi:lysophospholipid acyltransferase family protein [Pelagicoccus sp. SDUM812002]|uniref:lysophospholipid acyltransferase family protein n=1 Tax=Pelagicoccus sp. SDUM812002 TaxID=3041266 RepID=UPI00280FE9F8|nr:lysophospholipid acyltransferase family protein [Pelagicoccus sp. SDUM812002]MDQ8186364.1 lysophospholipid acyltransferase family protein [Pelagicoccus sp. SDUM812002]
MGFIGVLRLTTPDKTPRKATGGEIWVMNHPSILDGSYLLKYVTNGTCIYKDQIGSNPLYGSTAKLAQHIPNVGGPDMVRLACEVLARGEDLIIFPEGTRCTKADLSKFKSGFALIAKRSKAAINVMWMESPDDFMTREAPFWKVPQLTAEVDISRIERIEGGDCRSVRDILERVKECYAERASR